MFRFGSRQIVIQLFCCCWLICQVACSDVIPIKNLTDLEGDRSNDLIGFGVVAGLAGTGANSPMTRETLANIAQRFGQRLGPTERALIANNTQINTANLSVVIVTAKLKVTDRPGQVIDVAVASLDGAASLQGGNLLMTPLKGADNQVYAVAQGTVSIGGFSFGGDAASVVKNHATKGLCQATVERRTPVRETPLKSFRLLLRDADATTATRIVDAVNDLAPGSARAEDSGAVAVDIPPEYWFDRQRFISKTQLLEVEPDIRARVVVNEATGTVIIGGNVKLSPKVAVTHANLTIVTAETPEVSQPNPLAQGETVVVPRTEISVEEESNPVSVIEENASVHDLAQALNALGVTPRDLGAIFVMLRDQGSLRAELVLK